MAKRFRTIPFGNVSALGIASDHESLYQLSLRTSYSDVQQTALLRDVRRVLHRFLELYAQHNISSARPATTTVSSSKPFAPCKVITRTRGTLSSSMSGARVPIL